MNRFTKDMATIDDMLPLVLFDLIQVLKHQDLLNTSCLLLIMLLVTELMI